MTGRQQGAHGGDAATLEEMMASIREAIYAHAGEELHAREAPAVRPPPAEQALLAEEMPMTATSNPAEVAGMADADDIVWSGAGQQAEPTPREAAPSVRHHDENPSSARVLAMPQRHATPDIPTPMTAGALALDMKHLPQQPRQTTRQDALTPVVRLSDPVRGKVRQALDRLQARERLEENHQPAQDETALREMLRPLLEEWAREELPRLVREEVRKAVAMELARLSGSGSGHG